MHAVQAIILAAGKSSRLKTNRSKLLEKICGQEMISYPVQVIKQLDIPLTVVVGHYKDEITSVIRALIPDATFITQQEQHGTGHALMCTQSTWSKDHVLVLNGDMPLITQEVLYTLYEKHLTTNAMLSFVTAYHADPTDKSYGRVIKTKHTIEIIEAKHFIGDINEHCFINAGIYLINRHFLEENISFLTKNNSTQEFYLTDFIKRASDTQQIVSTTVAPFDAILGVNTYQELWKAEYTKKSTLILFWMEHGVRFANPSTVHLDEDTTIGAGSFIGAGVHLLKGTHIGSNCTIQEYSILSNTIVADHAIIKPFCVISDATISCHTEIGPFAHIQSSSINQKSSIGNFVEIKRSRIGAETKAKHLTYLGDTTLGNKINIGAGTITCNYNGFTKHTTTIDDNTHIGSNTTIVAPLAIGKNVITGAGSVITQPIPDHTLAIARTPQINKVGYTPVLQKKYRIQTETS